jgi:nitrate/nitrite-specific signal transduction histidine kinase
MVSVFFVYGLAFFSMGFAVALESRKSSGLRLAASLPYLAAFGILHALVEWSDMMTLIQSADAGASLEPLRVVRTVLFGIAGGALLQFGAGLLVNGIGRAAWLRWVPAGLGLAWVLTVLTVTSFFPIGGRLWLTYADIWARYLLCLPGALLAGAGLLYEAGLLAKSDFPKIARDARLAAGAFLLYALTIGLVAPEADFLPVSPIHYDTFRETFGFPVQLLLAAMAVAIAFFVLRVLRVFEIQSNRLVEAANRRRLEAQQEALEAQRRAREEAERWNLELEERILQRTVEITVRNKQLLALNSIAASVNQSLNLQAVLKQTLRETLEALGAEGGGIFIADGEGGEPTTRMSTGMPEELLTTISQTRLDAVVSGRLDSPDDPTLALDLVDRYDSMRKSLPSHSFLMAPLKAKECVVGVICVVRKSSSAFSPEEARLLTAIGHQVGVAVQNATLFGKVQNLATLEERERIAREMHDGLAQVVGFLNIKTRVIQQLVAAGRTEQAEKDLAQIQNIIAETYGDIRQSILSLRTATELESGLLAAIRETAADFTDQNSIPVELALADESEVCFPPEAEIQLVRIVQEALANVRKHSRASKAWIRLERTAQEAILTVEDDGTGFQLSDVAGKRRRSFGLETMRERAESIGASLEIIPMQGEGTTIRVRFPVGRDGAAFKELHKNPVG